MDIQYTNVYPTTYECNSYWWGGFSGESFCLPPLLCIVRPNLLRTSFRIHGCAADIASPQLCLAMRSNPPSVLAGYDLTPREKRRLVAVVNQRGMSTNCTLYRANRLTAIYTLLPLTCVVLGKHLKTELDLYWETHPSRDLQFKQECERFVWKSCSLPGFGIMSADDFDALLCSANNDDLIRRRWGRRRGRRYMNHRLHPRTHRSGSL